MKKPVKVILSAVGAGALLFVGIGIGGTQAPEPVVKTIQGETITKTKTVEVTPQVCLDAIYASDGLLGAYSDALTIAGDMVAQASEWDIDGLTVSNHDLDMLTEETAGMADNYQAKSTACFAQADVK